MITRNRIRAERAVAKNRERTREQFTDALVGDGNDVIDDTRRVNHVWVRLHGLDASVISVENQSPFTLRYDAAVVLTLVQQDAESHYVIVGPADWVEYEYASESASALNFVRSHAAQHIRGDAGTGGEDPVDVYARMVVMLRARAQDTPGMMLRVEAGFNPLTGNYVAAQDSPAFSAPTGLGAARFDLLYLDDADTLQILQGTKVVGGTLVYPAIPAGSVPLAYVYLTNATTTLTESEIYDARMLPSARFDTSPSLPAATRMGQVFFSVDGATFVQALPLTDAAAGWLVDDPTGLMLVTV